jgi:hypothetical protein
VRIPPRFGAGISVTGHAVEMVGWQVSRPLGWEGLALGAGR